MIHYSRTRILQLYNFIQLFTTFTLAADNFTFFFFFYNCYYGVREYNINELWTVRIQQEAGKSGDSNNGRYNKKREKQRFFCFASFDGEAISSSSPTHQRPGWVVEIQGTNKDTECLGWLY